MCHDDTDGWDGPDWEDWMLIGPLSEDMAEERQEQERLEREADEDREFEGE